jgi:hypothetical protein
MISFRKKIKTSSDYLISKRSPHDGGWALNIEKVFQVSSIVNTAEALSIIHMANLTLNDTSQTVEFLKDAIQDHPKTRGNNLRYYIYGLLGLLYAGIDRTDSFMIETARTVEQRIINGLGWAEHQADEDVRTWQTSLGLWVLTEIFGKEYVLANYQKCINHIRKLGKESDYTWGWELTSGAQPSLAGTSCMLNILSMLFPDEPGLMHAQNNVIEMLNRALDKEQYLEVEAISGTDWNHYSYCWALRAIHLCPVSLDQKGYWVTLKALKYIDSLFDGRGFREPTGTICNTRSVFNNVMGINSVITGFDPALYFILEDIANEKGMTE